MKAALSDPSHSKIELAELYIEAGKHDIAQKIYTEFAEKKSCDPDKSKDFLYPHCLQHISDLWEKAQNTEKRREAQFSRIFYETQFQANRLPHSETRGIHEKSKIEG